MEFPSRIAGLPEPLPPAMRHSDTHTCSSTASSHTQLAASITDLTLKSLQFSVWFCPLHMTAFVNFYLYRCFYPHACCESGSHPIFFFPSSYLVHHGDGIGQLGLRLDGILQIKLVFHERLPKLPQDTFPCELGSCTFFGIWPPSSSLFVKLDSLFFSFRRTHRRNSVRLSSDYQPREQVPKHRPTLDPNLSRGDSCHQGSTQTTTTKEQTPSPAAETRISHILILIRKHNRSIIFASDVTLVSGQRDLKVLSFNEAGPGAKPRTRVLGTLLEMHKLRVTCNQVSYTPDNVPWIRRHPQQK